MAGGLVLALEKKLLDLVFGAVSYTAPPTHYIRLWTVAPDHTGAGGTEVSGGGYTPLAVTNNTTNFPNASGDPAQKKNGVILTFATPSAGWGDIVAWSSSSASTGNPDELVVPVDPAKTVGAGDPPRFDVDAFVVQFRNQP